MHSGNFKKLGILFLIFILVLSSCHTKKHSASPSFVILAINDVYRIEGLDQGNVGGLARVRALRNQLESEGKKVLLLHAGDFLYPSFSSRVDNGESMIHVLNFLDGFSPQFDDDMIITFGNHEFDKGKMKYMSNLQQRIDESEFNWLDSNINWKRDDELGVISSEKMHKWLMKDYSGIKVGIFSLMTDMAKPEYIAGFDDTVEVTKHYVRFLKEKGADVIVALTHQQMSDDRKIMNLDMKDRPDLIIGGHEHYRQLEQIDNHWITKADADAVSATVIEVSKTHDGNINFLPAFIDLDKDFKPDNFVQQIVNNMVVMTDSQYCRKLKLEDYCLESAYGTTKVTLKAEESEIRRFETNIGNFIADTAREEFDHCHADIAFINSGGVRLNHDIEANSSITKKHIEGMFPYSTELKLIKINGEILKKVITHSIDMWTANGHWLLTSGFKYTHNPEKQQFTNLRWSKNDRFVENDEEIFAVVPQYIIDDNTDHDGYDMIDSSMIVNCNKNGSSLKQLVIQKIQFISGGIAPVVDGRICNTLRDNCPE